jgi:hypothetical protein
MTRDDMERDDTSRDGELRELLAAATGSPRLANRQELLDALVARVEAGGVDVAEAPSPSPMLEPVPGDSPRGRLGTRITGIGVAGWIVIAVGAAAAATASALLLLEPSSEAPPQIPPSTAASATPRIGDILINPSAPASPFEPEEFELPSVDITAPALPHPSLPDPAGIAPADVVDAVAPVVSALDTSGLIGGALDLVACTGTAPVVATASDDTGVTSATVRVSVADAEMARVAMTHTGGGRWSAAVAPLGAGSVGSVTGSATVTVEARDAAGNVGSHHATVPLGALACLS